MAAVKDLAHRMIPAPLVGMLGQRRIKRRARRLGKMPLDQAFDEIYRHGWWQQGESLSGCGSEGAFARESVSIVARFIAEHKVRSVVDVGCGDFSIGQHLAPLVERYHAVDVSRTIITLNRASYRHLKNTTFDYLNVVEDVVPTADLVLVRQVLQHLSNAQIERSLINIERSGAPHILIAEHVCRPGCMVQPNRDLEHHSVDTRISRGSGVDIGFPPFSRARSVIAAIEPDEVNRAEKNTVLAVYRLDEGGVRTGA